MSKAGVKISPSAFSRLMRRMQRAGYLYARTETGPNGCRMVRPRTFEVTDLGVGVWLRVREFYAAADGPSADFEPLAIEEGRLAHLPREKRRALIKRRTRRQLNRIFERYLGRRLGGG